MKRVFIMCLVVLLVVTVSMAQSQSNNDEADPFDGVKIVGEKKVTAAIAVTKIPEAYAGFEKGGFAKYASAFGVHVFGTADARDEKVLHAAKVIAEYLDNDRDGVPDNMWLLSNMISRKATITMPRTQGGFGKLDRSQWRGLGHRTQGLWDEESRPGFINEDGSINREVRQDAALEEIFHLVCDTGYSKAYPEAFDPVPGTALSECMDIARAGHYENPPTDGPKAGYPEEAWYHYDDETCDYGCMAVEYMYWGMTSILGVQEFNYLNRPASGEGPSREWGAYTPELMQTMDPCLTDLLTDPKYELPTKAPDGRYSPSATPTITVPLIAVNRD